MLSDEWWEGYEAFMDDASPDCPYEYASAEANDWCGGYAEARRGWEEE